MSKEASIMKRKLRTLLPVLMLSFCFVFLVGCGSSMKDSAEVTMNTPGTQAPGGETSENPEEKTEASAISTLEKSNLQSKGALNEMELVLMINDIAVDVNWESNETVKELMEQATSTDIVVNMSIYGGWEQVGSLGKSYTRNDKQIVAGCGDIVLYSGNQIVVFYGSNSWAYTRLGKMNMSDEEVKKLLSNGDVTLTLTVKKGN